MPLVVGETIGPYRIIEQLGQGGMATVFKAYHANLDRYVAIKALHPAFMEDKTFLARFQREARVVAKLEHPNIVPVYDFSEHEGRPYLVMKFIEGETLKSRLHRQPLPPEQTLQIATSIGAALTYAHQQDILHRDVKPSNIILANDGQVYLADFGLARIASAGESTLSSDMMLGTPQYISPEQALGKRDLDAGTDIYSFGVVLYEMVVGKVPFSGDTPYAVIHDHIYTPLPLPRLYKSDVPDAVERVLLKALAKERVDRYADIAALMTAFRLALGNMPALLAETALVDLPEQVTLLKAPTPPPTPVDLTPPPAAQTMAPPSKKSRRKVFVAGCAGLLAVFLCACVILALINNNQKKQAEFQATQSAPALRPTLPIVAGAPPPGQTPLPQEPGRPGPFSYETGFNGELPGWESNQNWERRDDTICAPGKAVAVYQGHVWGDFTTIFHFKGDGVFRFGVRINDQPLRRYIITIDQGAQTATLSKQLTEREITKELVSGQVVLKPDEWNKVLLMVRADVLELNINDQPVWSFRDERPLAEGWVGFENLEGLVCLNDFFIQEIPPE